MSVALESRLSPAASPVTPPAGRLRIAFLSYRSDPRVGGQGVFLARAAAALAARGHSVDILSGPPYPETPAGVRLIPIPSLDLYAQPHHGHRALRWAHLTRWSDTAEYFGHLSGAFMEPYAFGRRVAAYLRDRIHEYDVALDNQSLATGLLAIERAGLPVVGIVHHPIHRDLELALAAEPREGARWLLRRWYSFLSMQEKVAPQLRRVIVVSRASLRDAQRCLGLDPVRASVVPLGVDPQVFRPHPFSERHPSRLVTTATADTPLKGLRYLLEAYARLAARRADLELVVVGRPREGQTEALLARLGIAQRVRCVHDLSAGEMAALFGQATICVTPSLYEGFGLPAAEAMATGAAVVATDGGALPEVVAEAGVIVPAGDSHALERAIETLLDSPARRRALGEAAMRRAHECFSWERVAERYETILRAAIATEC